jgi:putative acetyltransferase
MNIIITPENSKHFKEVYQLHKIAFSNENEAELVSNLRSSDTFIPGLSIVAIMNNKVVGHILFTKIKIVNKNNDEIESLALAPLSVLPQFQGTGIGGQLITTGLNCAKELGFRSIIVLGHRNYYPKFGFESAQKWNIQSPIKISERAGFMALELVKDGLKDVSGTVKYPKEFDLL